MNLMNKTNSTMLMLIYMMNMRLIVSKANVKQVRTYSEILKMKSTLKRVRQKRRIWKQKQPPTIAVDPCLWFKITPPVLKPKLNY